MTNTRAANEAFNPLNDALEVHVKPLSELSCRALDWEGD